MVSKDARSYQSALADAPGGDDYVRGNLDGDLQLPKEPVRDRVVMDWEALTEPRLSPTHDVVGQALASFFTRDGGQVYLTQQMIADAARVSRVTANRALKDLEAVGRFTKTDTTTHQGNRGDAYELAGEHSGWVPARLDIPGRITVREFDLRRENTELKQALRDVYTWASQADGVNALPDTVLAVLASISDTPEKPEVSDEWAKLRLTSNADNTPLLSTTLNSALAEQAAQRPQTAATESQMNLILMHQDRAGLEETDVLASWPDIDRYSDVPVGLDPRFMTTVQANRVIQWMKGQPDAPVAEPPPPEPAPAVEPVCTCDGERAERQQDESARDIWDSTLTELEKELPRATFDTWLKGTKGMAWDGMDLLVDVPSEFTVAWLEQRMYQTILKALRRISGELLDVRFRAVLQCPLHPAQGESEDGPDGL